MEEAASLTAVGSEEARLRAGLRPPLKLHVQVSCMQLSRRLSDAGMTKKELSRATEQARGRHKAHNLPQSGRLFILRVIAIFHERPVSCRGRDDHR